MVFTPEHAGTGCVLFCRPYNGIYAGTGCVLFCRPYNGIYNMQVQEVSCSVGHTMVFMHVLWEC